MASTLHRLFRYASAPQNDPLENFTTEALAGAIRHDPAPILRVLSDAGISAPSAEMVAVHTQVSVAATGIVDLVLELAHEGRTAVVWIEVKVHAAETGDQLARYRAYAAAHSELDIRLVTLARGVVSPTTQALTWRAMRAVARVSDSPYWRDLSTFLEEIAMADDHDLAVSPSEASVLPDAFALMRKAERIVASAAKHANSVRPRWNWPTDAKEVRRQIADQFVNHARYVVVNRLVVPAWCFFGVVPGPSGADLAVVLETRPKAFDVRRRLVTAGQGLPEHWERMPPGWPLLRARVPLLDHAEPETASRWLGERIDELAGAGILELSEQLGAGVATVDEGSDDEM